LFETNQYTGLTRRIIQGIKGVKDASPWIFSTKTGFGCVPKIIHKYHILQIPKLFDIFLQSFGAFYIKITMLCRNI
jgi:hypothetical protein